MNTSNVVIFAAASGGRPERVNHAPAAFRSSVIDLAARRQAVSRAKPGPAAGPAGKLSSSEVREALNEGRVEVHYQPQYDLATGEMVSAEALIRLIDVDGNLVYPDRFIDMVEQSDLVLPLGRVVIERACEALRSFRNSGIDLKRLAVNVSAWQFSADRGLLDFVDQTVKHWGLVHGDLEFEITERHSLAPESSALAVIHALAARGSRIVIDDFGIGYSSVMYLTGMPVSAFKLDRALVSQLPGNKAMKVVVQNLMTLARDLEVEVVAEGVESQEQSDYLASLGCPFAQGFGFARPMNMDDFQAFVTDPAPTITVPAEF